MIFLVNLEKVAILSYILIKKVGQIMRQLLVFGVAVDSGMKVDAIFMWIIVKL